jgi:hypothetical protein
MELQSPTHDSTPHWSFFKSPSKPCRPAKIMPTTAPEVKWRGKFAPLVGDMPQPYRVSVTGERRAPVVGGSCRGMICEDAMTPRHLSTTWVSSSCHYLSALPQTSCVSSGRRRRRRMDIEKSRKSQVFPGQIWRIPTCVVSWVAIRRRVGTRWLNREGVGEGLRKVEGFS